MVGDIRVAEHIYIACGYTDMRKSIDGLSAMVREQVPHELFLSIPIPVRRPSCDRIKALLWEGDGFVLLYKRFENGSFQCPGNQVNYS